MTKYRLICRTCGPVEISEQVYLGQLMNADDRWYCPVCTRISDFDDEFYEKTLGSEAQ